MSSRVAPLLVFGWGNPSRGDDALGPLLVEQLADRAQAQLPAGRLECLTDFQLQVEHALDLVGRERVLFVDAAIGLQTPFAVSTVLPAPVAGFTTHALTPEALEELKRRLRSASVVAVLHHREPAPAMAQAVIY